MDINITVEQASEAVAIMKLTGTVDASNFMEIVDKAGEIYKNPARYLVIDLSDVPSVSTTGMVALHKIALIYSGVPR
jgi:anti-anti-sigma regulatory factor